MIYILSFTHYLALAIGFCAVIVRGIRLRESLNNNLIKPILIADNFWGLAAILWLSTGILRAFGGFEKGASYYLQNNWFWIKITLFTLIFILELVPMITFIKWRIKNKSLLNTSDFKLIKKILIINHIEASLTLIIPIFAVLMARGF